ncbi:tyrosine-type recombinase/integrase [Bacillus coreaensis]
MNSEFYMKQFALDQQFRLDPESVKRYQCAVKQLKEYTGKGIDAINKQDIRQWLNHLSEEGYQPWTIWSKVTGLKTFFKYCLEEGFLSINPAEKVPFPIIGEKQPSYLTKNELTQLRQLVEGRLPEERAIIELLHSTGMRISELLAMKKEDIKWSERMIQIPKGKQKRGRIVLFTRECEIHLKAYMENRTYETTFVFESRKLKDRTMHPDAVGNWFRAYSKELGFRVTPHTLRHTFTAHLAQKGMPLDHIQALLGHEDPKQTRFYARLYNQARKEMYDEFM